MNEHHVTSREWSERLKKAGVEQKSEFAWYVAREYFCQTEKVPEGKPFLQENVGEDVDFPYKLICASFLSDELAGMLPERISHRRCLYITPTPEELRPDENNWYVFYEKATTFFEETNNPEFGADTLPNALASMVEYCKQKGLI